MDRQQKRISVGLLCAKGIAVTARDEKVEVQFCAQESGFGVRRSVTGRVRRANLAPLFLIRGIRAIRGYLLLLAKLTKPVPNATISFFDFSS
jgi:hypothetical protein